MSVLIIVESYFGNTLAAADAIGAGLSSARGSADVTIVPAHEAPTLIPSDVDTLLVGAPTHDFAMPRAQTRQQAVDKGGTHGGPSGVREWIAAVEVRPDVPVLTFDTAFEKRLSGSAAASAAKALRKRGFRRAERGPSFHVGGRSGPLGDGERNRAEDWGRSLAVRPATHSR